MITKEKFLVLLGRNEFGIINDFSHRATRKRKLGRCKFCAFQQSRRGAKGGKMRKYEEAIKDILGGFREAKNDT